MEGPMRNALILAAVVGLASPAFAQNTGSGSSAQHELRSIGYARLGYGGASADQFRAAPAIGFGYRAELESFALDISFFNYVIRADSYETGRDVFAGSLLRLQALHFFDAEADRSAYVGAGLSWGRRERQPRIIRGHLLEQLERIRVAGRTDRWLRADEKHSDAVLHPDRHRTAVLQGQVSVI
jgi:hypothetical protein